MTSGAAAGSIIAAIIVTHMVRNDGYEPSGVATPMSIPIIRGTATAHDAVASPSVAATAIGAVPVLVSVLVAVMAVHP
jgi:hypothetical protein